MRNFKDGMSSNIARLQVEFSMVSDSVTVLCCQKGGNFTEVSWIFRLSERPIRRSIEFLSRGLEFITFIDWQGKLSQSSWFL